MTIKQQGGVFGRNPTFHDVEADLLDLNGPLQVDATGSYFQIPTSTNARAFYLKQSNDYGYSFNLDSQSTGDLMIKSVNNGVEADLIKASRVSGHVTIANNLIISNAGSGIDFSATSGTGTSELFDDYEEGTWTPSWSTDGVDFDSVTYNSQVGYYTKIGRQVFCTFYIDQLALDRTSATGNLIITGLPFTASANRPGGGSPTYLGNWTTNYSPTAFRVNLSSTFAYLWLRNTSNGPFAIVPATNVATGNTGNRCEGFLSYYV